MLKILESLTNKLNEPAINSKVLHALLDQCADAYWIWEVATGYDYLSEGWQRLLGYSADELPHHYDTWKRLLPAEDYDKAYAAVKEHFDSGGKIPYEAVFRMRRKDRTFANVIATGAVVEWDGPEPIVMAGKLTLLPRLAAIMHPGDSNGWHEWSKHVLIELKRFNSEIRELEEQCRKVNVELAQLKVKSGIWGAFGSIIILIPTLIIYLLTKAN